jgi:hypothetical protein
MTTIKMVQVLAVVVTTGAAALGCAAAAEVAPTAILLVEEAACVVEHYSEPVPQILSECGIGSQKQAAVEQLSKSVAAKMKSEKAAAHCPQ